MYIRKLNEFCPERSEIQKVLTIGFDITKMRRIPHFTLNWPECNCIEMKEPHKLMADYMNYCVNGVRITIAIIMNTLPGPFY